MIALSVSVAAYNVEQTLERALLPFCQFDGKGTVEVLVIDDGSTDHTKEIALQFEARYPSVFRTISKENGGWGSTLNVGIQNAAGTYFKQLDGDDYFDPDILDLFVQYLSDADSDFVFTPFVVFDNKSDAFVREENDYSAFSDEKTYLLDDYSELFPSMHSITIKTDLLKANRITISEYCYYTDLEYIFKCMYCCRSFRYFPWPVYYYRTAYEGQSMSISGIRKHYIEHEAVVKKCVNMLSEEGINPNRYRQLFNRLSGACNLQYCFYCSLELTKGHKQQLQAFDQWLLTEAPELYRTVSSRAIICLRRCNFYGYRLFCRLKNSSDKIHRRFVYEK